MLPIFAHATAATAGIQPGRTCRVGASIVPGACHVGARGLGMLGADIIAATASGEHGPGLMFNDALSADREYRLVITGSTFASGTLQVFEDGSIEFTGAGTATQSLYESSALLNTAPLDAGYLPPEYAGALPALTQARTMAALAASYTAPGYAGVLAGMQSARNMAPLAATYGPPGYSGAIPALTQARTMTALAAVYTAPGYAGVLAGMQSARSMAALAATYAPPGVPVLPAMLVASSMPAVAGSFVAPNFAGLLPDMQLARTMPPVVASYAPPAYSGVLQGMQGANSMPGIAGSFGAPNYSGMLGSMVAARTMPAVAGTFSGAQWAGTLGSMVAASSMPAVAGSYGAPNYAGQLPAMAAAAGLPGMAALYSAVAYSGVLAPMTAGSLMPVFTLSGYVEAWQRALREYTLLAPVDQIDHLGGFAEKDPAARVTLAFEFKRFTTTPDGATVEIAVWRGADGSALNVLDGAPAIVGTKVYQRVHGGVHDTDYKLTCMLTDAGGQAYVLTGVLPVRRR